MSVKVLNGKRFAQMVIQGANHLSNNAKTVDALNVFPVPDGDTGTNMNLSITSGAKEVKNNVSEHIGKVGSALAKGLLMGARGNSGVILSQLFRGFSKHIESKATITSADFAQALEAGVQTAYKAVMKPVEGTILTVAKDAAKKAIAVAKSEEDIIVLMEETLKEANASLKRTPDLLPVLKEVGVVDSGGQGLVYIYEGFLAELKGQRIEDIVPTTTMNELVSAEHHKNIHSSINTEDIEFGYCTEFMVKFEEDKLKESPFTEENFRNELSEFGDSLLVIADEELVKVHIHAEQPGDVLTYGQRYGSLINMKIENMREQHSNLLFQEEDYPTVTPEVPKKREKFGIITVAMGEGIAEMFRSIGAKAVIEGGQTMNPSTEDILKAIAEVNADNVIILPNNSNIVMAAKQAAEVAEQNVAVVESKTVPQGMAAILAFNPTGELDENEETMREALKTVKTGQITFAVRDTNIDGIEIQKDDFMGIFDGKIVLTSKDKRQAAKDLMKNMMDEDSEILTVIYGEDVTESEVNELVQELEETYPDAEVEVHNGKQPLYSYIFSIE
ncbi:DAK2 domain-containing protein [Sutcliffiella deserti]|uniref:DAK2 domain-containing protein n=1 Tax=Sutcliffiella deserti TaxID=2875501 RepID=UPI001CBF0ECE|nr:DAK2 domain-containing protein [Sutcliffiella deserti]